MQSFPFTLDPCCCPTDCSLNSREALIALKIKIVHWCLARVPQVSDPAAPSSSPVVHKLVELPLSTAHRAKEKPSCLVLASGKRLLITAAAVPGPVLGGR